MGKKKIVKIEEFFIQKGNCFFTGRKSEFNGLPIFTSKIEKAQSFTSVWRALDEMKTWTLGQSIHCRIYVRIKA